MLSLSQTFVMTARKRSTMMITLMLVMAACGQNAPAESEKVETPNIVFIMADDMGYGDMGGYNAESKAPTPSLDQLAREGMQFSDAHSAASLCTPSRYGLLTGRYAWRSRLKQSNVRAYGRKLIEDGRETLATLLKGQGYQTAVIGKWHLGLSNNTQEEEVKEKPYWNDAGEIENGVLTVGFDHGFIIPSSLDIPPFVFVENDKFTGKLREKRIPAGERKRFGGDGYWRAGEIAEGFDHEEVLPIFTQKAVSYIHAQAADKDDPFFLYMPLPAPHTPWMPTEKFRGISGAGPYGDFMAQVDDTVRQVLKALADSGVEDETLLIFASDNGSKWPQMDIDKYGHLSNGQWKGQKADIYEGGHRVPFIVKWPGKVKAGSHSDQLMVFTDVMATFADYFSVDLKADAGPDSVSILPVLLGQGDGARSSAIHHAGNGMFAIRRGQWKLIEGLGSGGNTAPKMIKPAAGEVPYQLYNLVEDPAEKDNAAAENPDIVAKLLKELNSIRAE